MTEVAARTNGDWVEPIVAGVKGSMVQALAYAREHPDEAALGLAPTVLIMLATCRHNLSLPERVLLSQVGYWSGVLAVSAYREWKTKPTQLPRLKVA